MSEENTDRNFEQEAQQQGWKPKEEFSGDENKWVDAKTFVERGEQFAGILKDRFEKVERKLKYQEQVTADIKSAYKKLEESKKKETEALIVQLEKQRRVAVTNGDGEAFERAEKELAKAKQEAVEPQTITSAAVNDPPEWAKGWMTENRWYGQDKAMTTIAETYAEELRTANPMLADLDFMKEVTEYVKTQFPHKFENQNKRKGSDVETEGSSGATKPSGGATFGALPSDAKAQFNRLVREGLFKDDDTGKKEFVRLYND